MDHECSKNWIGGAYSRKKSLLPHRYYAFMSVVDRVILEISRVIEAVFDGIEYRKAKVARDRAAKQTIAFSPESSPACLKNRLKRELTRYAHLAYKVKIPTR